MRDSKLFVIISLLFLLLVSLSGLFYLYQQNESIQKAQDTQIKLIVAKHDINQNSKIKKEDLKTILMAKSMVTFKPLIEGEIIGKYAAVPIFKEEPIRSEKISKLIEKEDHNSTAKKAKYDLYNIATKHFKNTNYMLKSGDLIDIIGVWEENGKFVITYCAESAEVHGFLFHGVLEEKAMKKVDKVVKDPKTKKEVIIPRYQQADEILLDTDGKIITSIIKAHNKGDQLWMVMSGAEDKKKILEEIKQSYTVKEIPVKKSVVKKRKRRASNLQATISYGASEKHSVSVWK